MRIFLRISAVILGGFFVNNCCMICGGKRFGCFGEGHVVNKFIAVVVACPLFVFNVDCMLH